MKYRLEQRLQLNQNRTFTPEEMVLYFRNEYVMDKGELKRCRVCDRCVPYIMGYWHYEKHHSDILQMEIEAQKRALGR